MYIYIYIYTHSNSVLLGNMDTPSSSLATTRLKKRTWDDPTLVKLSDLRGRRDEAFGLNRTHVRYQHEIQLIDLREKLQEHPHMIHGKIWLVSGYIFFP